MQEHPLIPQNPAAESNPLKNLSALLITINQFKMTQKGILGERNRKKRGE